MTGIDGYWHTLPKDRPVRPKNPGFIKNDDSKRPDHIRVPTHKRSDPKPPRPPKHKGSR